MHFLTLTTYTLLHCLLVASGACVPARDVCGMLVMRNTSPLGPDGLILVVVSLPSTVELDTITLASMVWAPGYPEQLDYVKSSS